MVRLCYSTSRVLLSASLKVLKTYFLSQLLESKCDGSFGVVYLQWLVTVNKM